MSSDIARGVIAKLREENQRLRRGIILKAIDFTSGIGNQIQKLNEPKRHAKNRRRA